MQLKAAHQVMREDGELEPGAVGPVVIGGHHVEGKFILMETFPPDEQQMAMALWGVGLMVAPILGPTLGGWITDN